MSSNPMKIGTEHTVGFMKDGKVIGEVVLKRVGPAGTEMVVLRDTSKDGFLMFVMALESIEAMLSAERDPEWKVKLLSWRAMFTKIGEQRRGNPPPPDDEADIPF